MSESNTNIWDSNRLLQEVLSLSERYPFLNLQGLGMSLLGKEIPLIRLGNGKRNYLYVAGHHGTEWLTCGLLIRFIEDFCSYCERKEPQYGIYPHLFLEQNSLFIIPMLNPDGIDYQIHGVSEENPLYQRLLTMNHGSSDFSKWQANARGVDLNHNYDAGFLEYKQLEKQEGIPCGASTRFSGQEPESEPETKALCNLLRFYEPWRAVLTLHTQGEEIYATGAESIPGLVQFARQAERLTGYRFASVEGLASYGGLTDFCIQKLQTPALTLECGLGKNPLPIETLPQIYQRLRKLFFTLPKLI